jgi:hypothetical protein
MARRDCYERISFFPSRISWGEDWYLWCVFALYFDVGYFAEPMVCYREHDLSMTSTLMQENPEICAANDLAMPWVVRQKALEAGCRRPSTIFLHAAADQYIRSVTSRRYQMSEWCISLGQFEESLCRNTPSETERNWVRARVYAGIGDEYYLQGELPLARRFYLAGLQKDLTMAKVVAKLFLLLLGSPGDQLRRGLRLFRRNKIIAGVVQSE